MSDFQDFLKRQCAHVAIGEFKPGKFSEAQRLYEEAVKSYGHGFKGAHLLQEPGTNRALSIIFWESIGDMDENQNEIHAAILKKMAPLFIQLPTNTLYEVVYETKPETVTIVS
ncbi:antibiotic biosynthesis monooxygenase [Prochlorothrix hollandica]|uniref:antibiotic biosynthesis monooxygenase n=1 Tax=Prochlorothrix hollandica TaxID=1223 RepID=UPI0033407B95